MEMVTERLYKMFNLDDVIIDRNAKLRRRPPKLPTTKAGLYHRDLMKNEKGK